MKFLIELEPFLLEIYAILIMFDFMTGVLASWKENRLKSRTMRDGLFRTSAEVILLALLLYFKSFVQLDFVVFGVLIIGLGLATKEGLSITENLYRLGVSVPNFLIKGLEIANNTLDNLDEVIDKEEHSKK